MWKSVRGGNCCWCKKFKEMEINNKQQKRKNISPSMIIDFLATNNLITKLTLHNMPFLKIGVMHQVKGYHSLSSMVEAHGFETMFMCCVFVWTLVNDICATKHWGKKLFYPYLFHVLHA
jgi:hypothetical protein